MTQTRAIGVFDELRLGAVSGRAALRRVYELPSDAAVRKQMTELTEQTRQLIGCSSLVFVASDPHGPKSLLRSSAWKPERWLPADAQPTSAQVSLAQLRMPELTIADIEQAEADMLKYRYE